jgi:NitT/TauT family transport system permease protein
MRRFLLALLFFVGLVAIWAALGHAKIWSPVLLPSPLSVLDYLAGVCWLGISSALPLDFRWGF